MEEAWILSGARTPIGKFMGSLKDVPAPELGSIAIQGALEKNGMSASEIDEVIMGNVISAGLGQAPARQAALGAGLPSSVSALTINKMCGSGLKAIMLATQVIRAGDAQLIVAGGMENMTRAPHLALKSREGWKLGDVTLKDSMLVDGLWCPFHDSHMGMHAQYVAEKNGLTREDLDQFSYESQQKSSQAIENGSFNEEIVPVTIKTRKGDVIVTQDEGPRAETTVEGLAKLRPAFSKDGIITAGNASMISDGAAAVIVASEQAAKNSNAPSKAKVIASATSGRDPKDLFEAPVDAVRMVLDKAGLKTDDIDIYELNEAFASQMLACQRQLEIDSAKINPYGGAISLGHPIGASGARVLVTLMTALKNKGLKRGIASLCLGGGNAVAILIEMDN
jgi:acetyl-CoA C-acetyltransferase